MTQQGTPHSIKRLSEVVDTGRFTRPRNMIELVGKEIVILDIRWNASRFGDRQYAVLTVSVDGKEMLVTTGIRSVMDVLEHVQPHLPVAARVVPDGRFYRLE